MYRLGFFRGVFELRFVGRDGGVIWVFGIEGFG